MNLVELIQRVGEEYICTQNLSECATNYQLSKKGTLITFGTDAFTPLEVMNGEEKKVGVIIWFDKQKYKEVFASVN